MDIHYHIGANCTDGERLLKSLTRNGDLFSRARIALPGPGRYRKLLRDTIVALNGQAPGPQTRDLLVDQILDNPAAERLVLSNPTFLCLPARVFEGGQFYPMAAFKAQIHQALFAGDCLSLFLGCRNPATFIPAVFAQVQPKSLSDFLQGADPLSVRWSDLVARLRAALPEAPITVWMNEDTPLIWAELLRRISGLPEGTTLQGENDLLAAIMQPEGFARFESYLATHPVSSEAQRRRVISAFLDKYALPEAIAEEVDLPGWDAALVDRLTRAYEADMERLAAMPGITFVAP